MVDGVKDKVDLEESVEEKVSDVSGSDDGVVNPEYEPLVNPFTDEPVDVSVVLPEEPGLYEYNKESADALVSHSGVPLVKEIFISKDTAIDALSFVGCSVLVFYRAVADESDDMQKLSAKIADVKAQMEKFLKEKSVRSFAAKTIGCKKCGSQLAKEYLKDDCCPLCGNDLRAASTIAAEADYRQRIASMEEELEGLGMLNQVRNGKICYLLKVV